MLDGTRDAASNVELWTDSLAGLANLVGMRDPPRIDGGSRATHRRTQCVRQSLQRLEAFCPANATTT